MSAFTTRLSPDSSQSRHIPVIVTFHTFGTFRFSDITQVSALENVMTFSHLAFHLDQLINIDNIRYQ